MSAIHEVLPGDALKLITQEHGYMGEFVDWMKRRLELDKKYTEELKALRMSANPQWSQSGLSPLVSPMLEFVSREVKERQATSDTMNTYLEELSNINSSDRDQETGESLTSRYEKLIAACKQHELLREEASSIEAVKDMKQWHEQGPNGTNGKRIHEINDLNLRYFTLPLSELSYRESIVQQQVLARAINTWHHSQFPERLDSHRNHCEEVKSLVTRMTSEYSRLLNAVARHLDATKNSVHEFSSSSFITRARDQHNSESEHIYMKEVMHVDFSNGTTRPYIIFGSVSQTLLEVKRIIKALKERDHLYNLGFAKPIKDRALELEQSATTQSGLQLQTLSNEDLSLLCSFALLNAPPLVPLFEEEIRRYANGIPRNKIHAIMSKVARQDEVAALFDILGSHAFNGSADSLFTHRKGTSIILEDI